MDIFTPAHPSNIRTQKSIQSKNYCIQNNEQQYSKSGFLRSFPNDNPAILRFSFPIAIISMMQTTLQTMARTLIIIAQTELSITALAIEKTTIKNVVTIYVQKNVFGKM